MPVSPMFCESCGGPLSTRLVEGRERTMCAACGTIRYQNPVPVVSCVLVQEGSLLLVRPNSASSRWSLPTGYAERGETIEDNALRALEERTGLRGIAPVLLGASTVQSERRGDLLVLSFWIPTWTGAPPPGVTARWFPLGDLPSPLPPHDVRTVERWRALHPGALIAGDNTSAERRRDRRSAGITEYSNGHRPADSVVENPTKAGENAAFDAELLR
ncbi:MAG: NUDIX hydrolase [Deltaproteobacteria bacterium]|nr:NUDIX hydrolase [Deltaproteobacteria bacterium]